MIPATRRRTFDPFDLIGREFDRALRGINGDDENRLVTAAYPVDIHEDDDHLYVEAEMPGFSRDEIDVTLEKGVLTLAGERKVEPREGESHLNERRYTRVHRRFTLPETVDENDVDARLEDGVLRLTLSKREEVKPRKIEVK